MSQRNDLVERFEGNDFHDAKVIAIRVLPAVSTDAPSQVEVDFQHRNEALTLILERCANLSLNLDFDVLKENLNLNTSGLRACASDEAILALVHDQVAYWDLRYISDSPDIYDHRFRSRLVTKEEAPVSPLQFKSSQPQRYVIFKVQFYGGLLTVIAEDFRLASKTVQ